MTELHFQHPAVLWLALVAPVLIVALAIGSRAEIGRRGRWASVVTRSIILMLCAIAAAGPRLERSHVDPIVPHVVILSDASQSVSDAAAARDGIAVAVRGALGPGTRVTELSFAGRPWKPGEPAAEDNETDIESALDAANAQTLESRDARVVVISDGRSTRGDAVGAAGRLAMRGATVHAIPVGRHHEKPPQVVRTEPPIDAHVGVPAGVRVTVSAERPVRVAIQLLGPDGQIADRVELPVEGRKTAVLRFTPRKAGVESYTVTLAPLPGALAAGASAAAPPQPVPVFVQGPPRILLADNFTDEMQALKRSLEPLKIPIDVMTPDDWPKDLTPYAAVVASDWSGRELTDEQRAALRTYVEEHGGGLVFIGGGNVLPARWKQNPLAAALPVVLQEKPKELTLKKADASVVFVVDRSGSMSQGLASTTGGPAVSKLDLVKAAIITSVQTLPPRTQVAVVTFDNQATVLVPPTSVSQKDEISRLVDSTAPGGGTVIEPAIRQGMALLASMPGDKYLVVLTDGIGERPSSDLAYWGAVAADAKRARMSWTSIAVGRDADQSLLSFLAQEARGKYFFCDTADSIPKVFLDQAKSIKRVSEQKEKPFRPKPGPAADRLRDLDPTEMPELSGRVRATARDHVDVILLGESNEPLLSSWQFGLGRVTAFTSDAKGGWAKEWVTWKDYSSFWVQILQGVMRTNPALHARVRMHQTGTEGTFNYQVTDQRGRPMDGLHPSGGFVASGATGSQAGGDASAAGASSADGAPVAAPSTAPSGGDVRWGQVGPGEYQAHVDIPPDGRQYMVSMRLASTDDKAVNYAAVVSAEQNRELSETGPDIAALRAITDAGGGTCSSDPADVAAACRASGHPQQLRTEQSPLWPGLMIAALLLWPIDVAARKFL